MTSEVYVLDFETSKAPRHLPWVPGSFAVCLTLIGPGVNKFWLFNHEVLGEDYDQKEVYQDCVETFQKIPSGSTLVAHNAKFELVWLKHLGIPHDHLMIECTMIMSYLLEGQRKVSDDGQQFSYSLRECCKRASLTGKTDLVGEYWAGGYDTDCIPIRVLYRYNQNDCAITRALHAHYRTRLHAISEEGVSGHVWPKGGIWPLVQLCHEEMIALAEIESNGMQVDLEVNDGNIRTYTDRIANLDECLRNATGRHFNLKSNDQRSALLFGGCYTVGARVWVSTPRGIKTSRDTLVKYYPGLGFPTVGVPKGKKHHTYGGKQYPVYNTDKMTISQLKAKTPEQEKVLDILRERAILEKQLNTYFRSIQELTVNNRLHPNMMQTVTATGRLSCRAPNLQNVSRGSTSPVKQCFVSRYGE